MVNEIYNTELIKRTVSFQACITDAIIETGSEEDKCGVL